MTLSDACAATTRQYLALLALGAACAVGNPAAAQQPSEEQISAIRSNCRSDFISHCSGVQPGGAEAFQCLARNLSQLSPACRGAVSAAMPAAHPPAAAAPAKTEPATTATAPAQHPPAHTATPAAPAPHAPAAHPPATHPPAAAKPAVAATTPAAPPPPALIPLAPMPQLPLRVELLLLRICAADKTAHCNVVMPGGGRIIACLADNEPALQPECKEAMAEAKKYD
jgi:hypothetical protein